MYVRTMSLRARVASVLDRSGAIRLAMRLPYLRMVGYHRIGDPAVVARDTDEGVVDATADAFARHVAFVARRFEVIGVDRLRRYFVDGEPLPKRPAMITFDDGYRECFDVAFPILEKHGVPGVFFVSTGHVTNRRVFWWDRINWLFKRSIRARAEVDYPKAMVFEPGVDRARAIDEALTVVKRTYGLDLERYLRALASALDVGWTEADEARLAEETLVTWDHLRAMRSAGMDVQSHTATHRVLQTLSEEELDRELADSKRTLETELDAPVCAIAYPSGRAVGPIARAVRRAGYELGFAGSGVCRASRDTDPLDLRRISVDCGMPDAHYRAYVSLPPLGFGF